MVGFFQKPRVFHHLTWNRVGGPKFLGFFQEICGKTQHLPKLGAVDFPILGHPH